MRIRKIRATVISPINYYLIQGGRIERPGNFIGDIAIKYAILHQIGIGEFFKVSCYKPDYRELTEYDFWPTVAIPEGFDRNDFSDLPILMKPMIRNTMQGIDVDGSNTHRKINTGSIMYKNFYMQQFIKPGNVFFFYIVDNGNLDIPSVLRVGTGKVGALKMEEVPYSHMNAFVNLYTVKNILGKLVEFNSLNSMNFPFSQHISLPYYIVGPLNSEELLVRIYGK